MRNYTRKHLERGPFQELLAELRTRGTPLSMDQVVEHHISGDAYPKRSFALTFDDGFANNATIAAPVLREMELPAAFYITSTSVSSSHHPQDLKMVWEQVAQLAAEDLFIVAGHTHRHPIMAFLDDSDLNSEVDASLSLIARTTGAPVTHYAYPEGTPHAYSERVIEKLKSAGIVCSPTAIEGLNKPADDLFHLKRVMVDRR